SRRQEQARRSRVAVLREARRRFLADGYAATTVGAIAEGADVSVETVYKAFGNKAGLLKAVFDVAAVGDDEPASSRTWRWCAKAACARSTCGRPRPTGSASATNTSGRPSARCVPSAG